MIRIITMTLVLLLTLPAWAANTSRDELDARVHETVASLYEKSSAAQELSADAKGILVFPHVYKAGIGVGGEYGEGALLIDNQPVAYYNTAGASIGFQLGAQRMSQVIMFMSNEALEKFRNSKGWEAGVDGSVAIANLGAGGSLNTETLQQPIIGFVFSNEGLMYNLSLAGSKITEINK